MYSPSSRRAATESSYSSSSSSVLIVPMHDSRNALSAPGGLLEYSLQAAGSDLTLLGQGRFRPTQRSLNSNGARPEHEPPLPRVVREGVEPPPPTARLCFMNLYRHRIDAAPRAMTNVETSNDQAITKFKSRRSNSDFDIRNSFIISFSSFDIFRQISPCPHPRTRFTISANVRPRTEDARGLSSIELPPISGD